MSDQRSVTHYLIHQRRRARSALHELNIVADMNRAARRRAKQYRNSGNPIMIRRAETVEAQIAARNLVAKIWRDELAKIGRDLMTFADHINAALPTWEMCDLLEVNRVDRASIGAMDGIIEIAYIQSLEDSATHRGSDFKQGPLAQAVMRYISHQLATDAALQAKAHEHLFGKGGMFEFLPTYSRRPDGEFVKNPPKLRLADECDFKGAA